MMRVGFFRTSKTTSPARPGRLRVIVAGVVWSTCVAGMWGVGLLWAESYSHHLVLRRYVIPPFHDRQQTIRRRALSVFGGRVYFESSTHSWPNVSGIRTGTFYLRQYRKEAFVAAAPYANGRVAGPDGFRDTWTIAGIVLQHWDFRDRPRPQRIPGQPKEPDRGWMLVVPLWLVMAVLAVSLLAGIRRLRRLVLARRTAEAGLCPSCGYDLRATPGRCPECGWAPATGSVPAPL